LIKISNAKEQLSIYTDFVDASIFRECTGDDQ
jgi:hypothetical protein